MNQVSQLLQIQRHLAKGGTLTPVEALHKFNCLRLGARCWDLKQAGWPITKAWKKLWNGKRVAEYRFEIKR